MPCTLSCSLGLRTRKMPAALFSVLRTVSELPAAIVRAVSVDPGAVARPEINSIASPTFRLLLAALQFLGAQRVTDGLHALVVRRAALRLPRWQVQSCDGIQERLCSRGPCVTTAGNTLWETLGSNCRGARLEFILAGLVHALRETAARCSLCYSL